MKKIYTLISAAMLALSASATVELPATGTPITTPPEGKQVTYCRSTTAAALFYGAYLLTGFEDYVAADVVFADNGDVYFKDMITEFDVDGWLKGHLDGDTITMELPQPILNYTYRGDTSVYYAFNLDCQVDTTGALENGIMAENQTLKFLLSDDGIVQVGDSATLASQMLGLCTENAEWTYYAEMMYNYHKFADEKIVPDFQGDLEDYVLITPSDGHFVKVLRNDNAFYVRGISETFPDSWTKFEYDAQGNLTLAGGQYQGITKKHYSFTYPGSYVMKPYVGSTMYYDVTLQDSLTFFLDKESGVYATPDTACVVINGRKDMNTIYDYYISPRLQTQPDVTVATPATPEITTLVATNDAGSGLNYMVMTLPVTDTRGYLLDKNLLSYEIYFDGELFTLYNSDYQRLDYDELTRIPFTYTDDWDISCSGAYHQMYLYVDGFDEVGVRVFYDSPNGETYASAMATRRVNDSSIREVGSEGTETVSSQSFDLLGRQVGVGARGAVIKREVKADGSVKVTKQLR
jgi:hypothetical protein